MPLSPRTTLELFLPDRLWQMRPADGTDGRWLAFVTRSRQFPSFNDTGDCDRDQQLDEERVSTGDTQSYSAGSSARRTEAYRRGLELLGRRFTGLSARQIGAKQALFDALRESLIKVLDVSRHLTKRGRW